jgi:hypothetical protein
MKQSLAAVSLAAALAPLTITACNKVAEAVPIAEANADAATSTYVSEISAMHNAIVAGAGALIDEYY